MSDPITNGVPEDVVVSSIRRLVTKEGHHTRAPMQQPEQPNQEPETVGYNAAPAQKSALLLTPALRVVEVPESKSARRTDAVTEHRSDERDDGETLEAVTATPGDEDVFAQEIEQIEQEISERELAPESKPVRSIEEKVATLETLIRRAAFVSEPEPADDPNTIAARDGALLLCPSIRAETLSQHGGALQSNGFSENPGEFDTGQNAAAQKPGSEPRKSVVDDQLDADEAVLLDAEALRSMVAGIVRAELQGPLGERITRNVRKLVRREIYRALAASELE